MKKKICPTILFITFLVFLFNFQVLATFSENWSPGPPDFQTWPLPQKRYVSDEILVKFKSDPHPFQRIKIPQWRSFQETLSLYQKDPKVEYAEPNYLVQALMIPDDPYYPYQWHFDNREYGGIQMEQAWEKSLGAKVVVAVIDTGIAYENYGWRYQKAPDFAETCFVEGFDFANNNTHPNDDNGHGTHISGTIAQSTNNHLGVAGIASHTCLMPVKVLNSNGSGTHADVANGIYWAADHGAKVINLSLGSSQPSQTLENALAYAYHQGVTAVAAAGNDGPDGPDNYPAAYDKYVIAVGATRFDETLAPYSNTGNYLDLTAPGGDLNVDQNHDGYVDGILQQTFQKNGRRTDWGYYFFQGTSCATPHVSGVAALILSQDSSKTPDQVRTILQTTAEDHGSPGWDENYGWGIINAAALGAEMLTTTPSPTPTSLPKPTATPTITPTPEINVILEEIITSNTTIYQNYQVKAVIKNQINSSVNIVSHLEITDSRDRSANWTGIEDQEISLSTGERKTIIWEGEVPRRARSGSYLATVSLFSKEVLLDQKSNPFEVSRWSWR